MGLATIGIFVPLLPTVPFVLLAAYCFSRGSKRYHNWLLSQKTFGPIIQDWERYGMIRKRTKVVAAAGMFAMMSYPLIFGDLSFGLKTVITTTGVAVAGFLLTRPSRPKD